MFFAPSSNASTPLSSAFFSIGTQSSRNFFKLGGVHPFRVGRQDNRQPSVAVESSIFPLRGAGEDSTLR